ncbi:MAG: hypothetical protein KY444_07035 [Gemmatimonadetes bacterium]|nr:hypothetical protein [Gemmatimonadota bacterium]
MRRHRSIARSLAAFVAAALLLAGCADRGGTGEALLPEGAASSVQGGGGSLSKMAGSIPVFAVEKLIGADGGELGVPGYILSVPRGAVSQPTLFTFESVNNGYVEVRLTATSAGSSTHNDVGRAGFAVPVALSITYEPAGGLPSWLRLVVAWVRPDGALEAVPSLINPAAKTITGKLNHFSQYVVAGGN